MPAKSSSDPQATRTLFAHQPSAWLRRVPGRETFEWTPERPAAAFVVKRTTRDLVRDGWYERLRAGPLRSPGRREYDNLVKLAADGLPVPRAVAWAEEDGQSLVVMERVLHQRTLRDELAGCTAAERRVWLERLLELVLRLHGAGWYHRDLYLQHFVLAADRPLVLLDVGRARKEREPRERWFVKDLAALLHSTPPAVPLTERARFLSGYLAARGIEARRSRKRWAKAIEARRRRMARHVPRHGEGSA